VAIEIGAEIAQQFIKARQDLKITQLELAEKSRISLRLIKDLESGRRRTFNEDTLIRLCRALNLNYRDLMRPAAADETNPIIRPKAKRVLGLFILAIAAVAMVSIGINLSRKNPTEHLIRRDWIRPVDELVVHIADPVWLGNDSIYVYYYRLRSNQCPKAGQRDTVEIQWTYHFAPGARPVYCINAYGSWAPDEEIRLFKRTFWGDSTETFKFSYTAPGKPGMHTMRVFFATAYDFIPSFYGKPPKSQVVAPGCANFIQIPLEVLPK
jgi:transcriptional regulator with XRE-family HTH domain